jgi:hypothetical protein
LISDEDLAVDGSMMRAHARSKEPLAREKAKEGFRVQACSSLSWKLTGIL